jgi:hypothetical protein
MSKYLVPFSGGLDSTFLIWCLLKQGHTVDALCYNINDTPQEIRQNAAIDKLVPILQTHGSFRLFRERIGGHSSGIVGGHTPIVLGQVPHHMFHIVNNIRDHDFVAMAYVLGDHAISFLDEIEAIYNSYTGISDKGVSDILSDVAPNWGPCKHPKLVFPLKQLSKSIIYNLLPHDLRLNVTWCEDVCNVEDNCGKCKSCKTMLDIADDRFVKPEGVLKSDKEGSETNPIILPTLKKRPSKTKLISTRYKLNPTKMKTC